MNEEKQEAQEAQTEQPQSQEETVDYKALYLDEVQNAKKLRKRSQDAESSLSAFTKKQETQKVKQMQEKEQYKELYESVAPFKDKWQTYESNLEYIVGIKEESKPVNPQHQASAPRKVNLDKPYEQMTEQERKVWHEQTVNNYRKN